MFNNIKLISKKNQFEKALDLLRDFRKYYNEYNQIPLDRTENSQQFYFNNGIYLSPDAEILYCMIRHYKPRHVIEIGSGNSTLLAIQAIKFNGLLCDFTAVEPYPSKVMKDLADVTLIPKRLQDVPLSLFDQLENNDILFIDSSHVLTMDSDVQKEILEVLPRLKSGVLIHFHDIWLPEDYPKRWVVDKTRFWNEQYVLQAFLTYNSEFKVIWAGNFMTKYDLSEFFPAYRKQTDAPTSFWIKRI